MGQHTILLLLLPLLLLLAAACTGLLRHRCPSCCMAVAHRLVREGGGTGCAQGSVYKRVCINCCMCMAVAHRLQGGRRHGVCT